MFGCYWTCAYLIAGGYPPPRPGATPLHAAQGFEECPNVPAAFKLFDSFEGLLDHDAIGCELERKHAELVRSFLLELHEVGSSRVQVLSCRRSRGHHE